MKIVLIAIFLVGIAFILIRAENDKKNKEETDTKQCKYCMSEIDINARICPYCRKGQENRVILILLIIAAIILVPFAVFSIIVAKDNLGSGSTGKDYNYYNDYDRDDCYITLSEFNQIKAGMSYNEVKEIVGCEGTVISDSEVLDTKTTIYSWYGKHGVANANVTISDDKLINKTQIGLE